MDALEKKLLNLADAYLCTDREAISRDSVSLLGQLRKSGLTTIELRSLMRSSPKDFDAAIEASIEELQKDPPEPTSIFRQKENARALREKILGNTGNGYDLAQAIQGENIFFDIFLKTSLLEENDLRERAIRILKDSSRLPQDFENEFLQEAESFPNSLYQIRRGARKQQLETTRLEWERQKQHSRGCQEPHPGEQGTQKPS